MQLCSHTDASYLSVSKARSRAAAYFYLSIDDGAVLPPNHESKLPARPNGAFHVMSTVMHQFLSSATEVEVGAIFYGCKDTVPLPSSLPSAPSEKNFADGTERVATMAAYLLNFCAKNRNPKVRYYASDMRLCGHTNAS